ncbi:uncharacterized protein [Amphiura filiformis]|uniref:uncharacterized protein n=1 Tax=Amphiura filiformis TaxID=82378 RepID=UPI003B20E76C
MTALNVFHDEIAKLVLDENKTRQQVFEHLVQKYGNRWGLSLRSVKRHCQLHDLHRPNPESKTVSTRNGVKARIPIIAKVEQRQQDSDMSDSAETEQNMITTEQIVFECSNIPNDDQAAAAIPHSRDSQSQNAHVSDGADVLDDIEIMTEGEETNGQHGNDMVSIPITVIPGKTVPEQRVSLKEINKMLFV